MKDKELQVVFTNKARCRDCYRCIRNCPVKAIEMKKGQASVIDSRCIHCGTCIAECPQKAKTYRREVELVRELLKSGKKVAASIAPSFASFYEGWERVRIPSALRKIGFSYIAETSVGAYYTSQITKEIFNQKSSNGIISSACPAVVSYIEKYHPELIDRLAQTVSPMIAHSRHIKKRLGEEFKIVFIGPCIAKKAESDRKEYQDDIDYVITFDELNELFADEEINLANFEASDFDEYAPQNALLYPLSGGLLKTSGYDTDIAQTKVIALSGFEDVKEMADYLTKNNFENILFEPLFCKNGCINGKGITSEKNMFERKEEIFNYFKKYPNKEFKPIEGLDLTTNFYRDVAIDNKQYSEDELLQILEKTGNSSEENRLNCQSCGYNTCEEKARAVLDGMAEIDMCIPFMRRKAEMKNDKIIESSPNGIVIVDEHLKIISMNPAFRRFFMCSEAIIGKPISYLMDPEPFVRIATKHEDIIELTQKHENYGIVCHQIIYELKNEKQIVGIFVNITKNIADKSKLDDIRQRTIKEARQLLSHQISMAQNIAKLLAESTAQGEALVENILKITEEQSPTSVEAEKDKRGWIWDMYMSR